MASRKVLVVRTPLPYGIIDSSYTPANFAMDERICFPRNAIIKTKCADILLNQILVSLPNLTTLCIHDLNGFNEENLHLIADRLPNLRNLWLLGIYSSDFSIIPNRAFEMLFDKLNGLQTFGFFDDCRDHSILSRIPISVKHLLLYGDLRFPVRTLNYIVDRLHNSVEKLYFKYSSNAQTQGLFDCLRKFRNLNSLYLCSHNLKNSKFAILHHENLNDLSVSVHTFYWKNDDNSFTLPQFTNVKTLSIHIVHGRINTTRFKTFLAHFPALQILNFCVDLPLRNPFFQRIMKAISSLTSLKELNLKFAFESELKREFFHLLISNLLSLRILRIGIVYNDHLSVVTNLINVMQEFGGQLKAELYLLGNLEQTLGIKTNDNIELYHYHTTRRGYFTFNFERGHDFMQRNEC
ncbi:hypothetical protein B4U79_18421 [Dinothrombium tinctorium]|uniref:Uncharacterized protein n=1 Tax=Dinothrombium tinctorium TaxID=1965070 RepID=A0A3S3RNG1_9ACAR|nr:hypothetical protein B4U79_18567 [Dinothrombium tinctorium]RWS01438.1 hypothetical protein B4U79_18565 [Dinothrombium tinctorium]RWS03573.1 hypothetical protein B4U79_18421 [Dinothrombium tinctorium]